MFFFNPFNLKYFYIIEYFYMKNNTNPSPEDKTAVVGEAIVGKSVVGYVPNTIDSAKVDFSTVE